MKGKTNRSHGFTLVELLVVISIIGLLMSLLMPTISKATETIRTAMTRSRIKDIGMGLEEFHRDFGCFPPSRPYNASDPKTGAMNTGGANLVFYLRGPTANGWGTGAGGRMPFDLVIGTPTGSRPTRTFGPYYKVTEDDIKYTLPTSGTPVLIGIMDAYKPGGAILYWRYDTSLPPADTGTLRYLVGDDGVDSTGLNNYISQTAMDEIVRPSYTSGTTTTQNYIRLDFLLVSPGPDRRYGYVKTNTTTGLLEPGLKSDKGAISDDITNFN